MALYFIDFRHGRPGRADIMRGFARRALSDYAPPHIASFHCPLRRFRRRPQACLHERRELSRNRRAPAGPGEPPALRHQPGDDESDSTIIAPSRRYHIAFWCVSQRNREPAP